MDFQDTIKDVNSFYTQYDKTIATVNDLFDAIDANAGQESANELKQILSVLRKFWDKYSISNYFNAEAIVDEKFTSLTQKLNEVIDEETLFGLCKEIQVYFRNYSAIDTKPIVHRGSNEVINKLFDIVDEREPLINDKNLLFTITRMLYELVTDVLLIGCGISKLYAWNYGTDAYSLLTAEEQLIILLNQSIMIDRLHVSQYLLKTYLKRLNKLLDGFYYLHWFVYYVAGFLNFKIHNYRESNKYFTLVEKEKLLQKSNAQDKKRYFHSVLLIAYGYEYAGDFANAIKKLVMPVEDLYQLLESVETKNIGNNVFLIDFLNQLIEKASDNSLFSKFFHGYRITHNITNCDETDQYDIQVEILHALAHCVNEYSIQNHSANQDHCSRLLRFARALMAFIAKKNKEYWTCYATIHGEYRDYDIALKELCESSSKICEKEGKIKESLAAEIAFYQYYFGQIIHKQIDDEKEVFYNYCQKYSDDDAFCHLQIFEFRRLLRNYMSEMFDYLTKNSRKSNKIEGLPSTDSIQEAYDAICQLHPSAHMNVNIRAELRLMQRIYRIIDRLNSYLINPSNYNSKMLLNSCKRFCYTKKELGLSENANFPNYKEEESILPDEVNKTLFGEYGVAHCLNMTDSIFLLAPISGVVVYQYQTGTIDKLFDVNALLGLSPEVATQYFSYSDTRKVIADYRKVVSEDKQVHIENVDINSLTQKGVTNIYLWVSNVSSRLLQVNENGCFTRRLTNSVLFQNTIEKIVNEAQKEPNHCFERYSYFCEIYSVSLPWLEFINEKELHTNFLIYKRIINNTDEYLVLSGNFDDINAPYCEIHRLLDPIRVSQSLSSDRKHKNPKSSFSVIDIEELKKNIKEYYVSFIKIEEDVSNQEKFLNKYTDVKYRFDVEKLKSQKAETIKKIKANLKQLSSIISEEEYVEFVMAEFDSKYYGLFGLNY